MNKDNANRLLNRACEMLHGFEQTCRNMGLLNNEGQKELDAFFKEVKSLNEIDELCDLIEETSSVQLIHWPESQICIGCPHGQFVMGNADEEDDRIGDSAYLCYKPKDLYEGNCCTGEADIEPPTDNSNYKG